jgi:hypothetical protein
MSAQVQTRQPGKKVKLPDPLLINQQALIANRNIKPSAFQRKIQKARVVRREFPRIM